MEKVICILRISTLRQDIESQRVDMINYISSFGYKKDDIYWITGEGASAFKIDDAYKAVINEMFDVIDSKQSIKEVFSWHINRLGRDEEELHKIRKFLVSHKVQLRIKEPTLYLLNEDGTENPGMSLAFSMFATMARQQIEELRAKAKRAKALNRERGKYNGGFIAFGYTLDDDNNIIVDVDKAPLIRKIFHMYVNENKRAAEIARELTATGELWHTSQSSARTFVSSMVSNPIYCGGNSKDSRSFNSHHYKYIVHGQSYPAIISEDLYKKSRAIADELTKKSGTKFKGYIYYAKHLIFSNEGIPLTTYSSNCQYCVSTLTYPNNTRIHISINLIDSLCWYHTLKVLKRNSTKDIRQIRSDLRSKQLEYVNRVNVCNNRISALEDEIQRIEQRIIKGRLDDNIGDKMQDECYAKMIDLGVERDKYNEYISDIQVELENTVKEDYIRNFENITDDNERYNLVHKCISKIILTKLTKYKYEANIDGEVYLINANHTCKSITLNGHKIEFEYLNRFQRKR